MSGGAGGEPPPRCLCPGLGRPVERTWGPPDLLASPDPEQSRLRLALGSAAPQAARGLQSCGFPRRLVPQMFAEWMEERCGSCLLCASFAGLPGTPGDSTHVLTSFTARQSFQGRRQGCGTLWDGAGVWRPGLESCPEVGGCGSGRQEGPAVGNSNNSSSCKPEPSRPFLEYRNCTRFFTSIISLILWDHNKHLKPLMNMYYVPFLLLYNFTFNYGNFQTKRKLQ